MIAGRGATGEREWVDEVGGIWAGRRLTLTCLFTMRAGGVHRFDILGFYHTALKCVMILVFV